MVQHQWVRAMSCRINRNPGLRGRTALRSRFPVADPAAAARLQFKSASPFNSYIPFCLLECGHYLRYCCALFFYLLCALPEISRREGTHDDFTSTACCPLRYGCMD